MLRSCYYGNLTRVTPSRDLLSSLRTPERENALPALPDPTPEEREAQGQLHEKPGERAIVANGANNGDRGRRTADVR